MPKIVVPAVDQQYSQDFSKDAFATAQYIRKTYGPVINAAAGSVGLDPNWIIGYMIIESGVGNGTVNPTARSGAGAIGLMQLTPGTAWQTLENQAPAMNGPQMAFVQKYLPGYIKPGGITGLKSTWMPKITELLKNPEFNIWVGTMQLAQLCKYIIKKTGGLRMDQVVVAYNAGQGNYQKHVFSKGLAQVDTTTLVKQFPFAETRSYILKLLGKEGSMVMALRTA